MVLCAQTQHWVIGWPMEHDMTRALLAEMTSALHCNEPVSVTEWLQSVLLTASDAHCNRLQRIVTDYIQQCVGHTVHSRFSGNWLLPFLGKQEWKIFGNPGRPIPGCLGMDSLLNIKFLYLYLFLTSMCCILILPLVLVFILSDKVLAPSLSCTSYLLRMCCLYSWACWLYEGCHRHFWTFWWMEKSRTWWVMLIN